MKTKDTTKKNNIASRKKSLSQTPTGAIIKRKRRYGGVISVEEIEGGKKKQKSGLYYSPIVLSKYAKLGRSNSGKKHKKKKVLRGSAKKGSDFNPKF
eukprot:UN27922